MDGEGRAKGARTRGSRARVGAGRVRASAALTRLSAQGDRQGTRRGCRLGRRRGVASPRAAPDGAPPAIEHSTCVIRGTVTVAPFRARLSEFFRERPRDQIKSGTCLGKRRGCPV